MYNDHRDMDVTYYVFGIFYIICIMNEWSGLYVRNVPSA